MTRMCKGIVKKIAYEMTKLKSKKRWKKDE